MARSCFDRGTKCSFHVCNDREIQAQSIRAGQDHGMHILAHTILLSLLLAKIMPI